MIHIDIDDDDDDDDDDDEIFSVKHSGHRTEPFMLNRW